MVVRASWKRVLVMLINGINLKEEWIVIRDTSLLSSEAGNYFIL
jgi:hypothetical protein